MTVAGASPGLGRPPAPGRFPGGVFRNRFLGCLPYRFLGGLLRLAGLLLDTLAFGRALFCGSLFFPLVMHNKLANTT